MREDAVGVGAEIETDYIYCPSQSEPTVVQGFDNELFGEAVVTGSRLRLAELR